MFITSKRSGYTRDGQQFASGLFLILMQPKDSPDYPQYATTCADCGRTRDAHDTTTHIPECAEHGIIARLRARAVMNGLLPSDTDFADTPVSDCTACATRAATLARIGCRYFRLSSIRYPLRAVVRHVSMSQLGHFMMGNARVHGHRLTLSGSYGSDGLPDTVPAEVYARGVELPDELYNAWNNGGGWNGAGSEAPAMREWALEHLAELRA